MKKTILSLFAAAMMFPVVACADNRPIEVSQLPTPAKDFLDLHFKDAKVAFATLDRELADTTYEVHFADGSSVDFDRKGNWKDVECKNGSVPAAIVPEAIGNYVSTNHSERTIRSISRDRRDWEVELNNGFDLKFDTKFRMIEIDD